MATIQSQGNQHDAELQSLLNFYHWHKRSKRAASELATLFVKGDAKEAD